MSRSSFAALASRTTLSVALSLGSAVVLVHAQSAVAPQAPPTTAAPSPPPPSSTQTPWPDDRTIAFDPSFTIATLPNGLTYYLRHHDQPAKRVVLRLIVKTGSLHEDDRERGYAHFVEHMAFNGTRHFDPGQLVTFFEERGARFGAHVNAQTSFETTVYFLTVPSDRPELLDKGLLALADFAGAIAFDRREVDRERPIIVEEWRQRQGVGTRVQNRQMPVLYHGSRYVDRLPIGTRESIDGATPEALRRFHETWYRPDRMAVVVVGDVDAARARTLIGKHFSKLKARAPARPEPESRVPLHPDLLVSIVSDPELTSSAATVLHKMASMPKPDVASVRRGKVQGLVADMLNARLAEITRRPDAPFLSASFTAMGLGSRMDATGFSVRTRDGELAKGLEAALVEGRRVREHGYVQTELYRVKQTIHARIESGFKDKDKTQSASLASSCQFHFVEGTPLMSPEEGRELSLDLLSRITLEEVTKEARTLLAEPSVLLVTTPETAELQAPKEPDLREAIARARTAAVAAYDDTPVTRDLMPTKPTPGKVTASRTIAPLGVTVLTLSNGIDAWLKPTDFKQEQITFSLQGLGGTAMAEPAAYVEASLATAYVRTAGVGGLTTTELGKVLAGKLGGASPFIGLNTTGVNGGSTPSFLETALQLLYLHVTAPNDDRPALDVLKRQVTASLTNRQQSPPAAFADRLSAINLMGHYTTEVPTIARIERLEIAPLLAFYRERFARARDVRFIMAGAFDVATVTPLLEQYIGALPMGGVSATGGATAGDAAAERATTGNGAPVSAVGVGAGPVGAPRLDLRFPASIVKERVVKGRERGARTVMTFPTESTRDLEKMSAEGAVLGVLQTRLRERLREQLGQTYSVSVARSPSLQPFSAFSTVSVSFGSAPENIDALADAVLREVDALRREGPTDTEIRTHQELERRSLETAVKQNGYWLGSLQTALLLGHDPLTILERETRLASLTRPAVRDAATRLFPAERYTIVSLVPEPQTP